MNGDTSPFEAFRRAVSAAGTQRRFAKLVGLSQGRVSQLLTAREPLPVDYVLAAEKHFGVPRHELRPDFYPLEAAVS